MTTMMTFTRSVSGCSSSVVPDLFRDPFDAPFVLLKRPPVGHCCGVPLPNWDGTPAHSSGARGRHNGQPLPGLWRLQGGVA